MVIDKRDYYYIVQRGDSLRKIAEIHGMSGELGRSTIWIDDKNTHLHTDGAISDEEPGQSRQVKRQLYLNGSYIDYDHSQHSCQGVIVLYVDEKIWIPAEEKSDDSQKDSEDKAKIKKELSGDDLVYGISIKPDTEYELVLPVFNLRVEEDPNDTAIKDSKYILYSNDMDESYKKTLTVDDAVVKEDIIDYYFAGVNYELEYSLRIEPGKDENGKKEDPYFVFEKSKLNKSIKS